MHTKLKKIFFIFGGITAAVVLAMVIFILMLNMNNYRARIEAVASEATGMKVRIDGKIKLSLFPRPCLSFENILIQNRGMNVASAKKAKAGIGLLPLLRREILIQQISLISPTFNITKDRRGLLNLEPPEKKPAVPFVVKKIIIKEGRILYFDEKSNGKSEAKECDFTAQNLSVGGGEFLSALSFDGRLSCGEVKTKKWRISNLTAAIKARKDRFESDPFTMRVLGGNGTGAIKAVTRGKSLEYSLDFSITKFRFEEVLGTFQQKKSIRGELDMESHISMKGKNIDEMTRTAQGEVSLSGQNILLESLDLDSFLEKYERSRNVNLVDVGAFLFVGPLGALLTKGYDFGSVYKESLGGKSTIRKLVSDWRVKNGIAEAEDVAFVTRKNRVALKGRLNFVHDRFEDLRVAILDAKGCAIYSQRINGDFNKPRIDKPSAIHSLIGPIISLAKKPIEMLDWDKCEIFYRGSLKHP